jgi:hypothetical protein
MTVLSSTPYYKNTISSIYSNPQKELSVGQHTQLFLVLDGKRALIM